MTYVAWSHSWFLPRNKCRVMQPSPASCRLASKACCEKRRKICLKNELMENKTVSGKNVEADSSTAVQASDYRNALIASFLGWTLDAFDFFIVVFTVSAIANEFGKGIPAIAATISITLAFRPVGALIFGLMADRYGRRLPLMV